MYKNRRQIITGASVPVCLLAPLDVVRAVRLPSTPVPASSRAQPSRSPEPMHLKSSLVACAVILVALHGAPVSASGAVDADTQAAALALLRGKTCLGCHQVDTQRVGPPFNAVAQRYAGQPGAEDYLAQSIRNGGRYRWGKLSMAAQPQVSPDEAHEIARWILSLNPPAGQPKP
jgi:cytochrome c